MKEKSEQNSGRKFENFRELSFCSLFDLTFVESVPTTSDPNTSAKVSRYEWEPYRDTSWWCMYCFLPRGGRILFKSLTIEMGGVS